MLHVAIFTVLLFSFQTDSADCREGICLYKVYAKADGLPLNAPELNHDTNTNKYLSNTDAVDQKSKRIICRIEKLDTVKTEQHEVTKQWEQVFILHIDRRFLELTKWRTKYRVSVACIVYKNRIIGLAFFGHLNDDNSIPIYTATDMDGREYLGNILKKYIK